MTFCLRHWPHNWIMGNILQMTYFFSYHQINCVGSTLCWLPQMLL